MDAASALSFQHITERMYFIIDLHIFQYIDFQYECIQEETDLNFSKTVYNDTPKPVGLNHDRWIKILREY